MIWFETKFSEGKINVTDDGGFQLQVQSSPADFVSEI